MIVTLSGDLGTGKTTLTRGLLRALGWTASVKSPTYTLVEHYPFSSLYFYHFDFYRFIDPEEWETAGLSECFREDAVCVIEWPEARRHVVAASPISRSRLRTRLPPRARVARRAFARKARPANAR
jgi:tRNA threonylcarbamoyl adenosine modification protein YjeE